MIIPEGFAQVNFLFNLTSSDRQAEITFGVALVGVDPTPTELAEGVADDFIGTVMLNLSSSVVLEQTRVKFGPNETGPDATVATPGSGATSAVITSPNVAYLVRKSTNSGGRRGRGRWYIPGVAENDIDAGGNISAGTVSDWNTQLDNFLDALATNGQPMVLLHALSTVEGAPPPPAPTTVTGLSLDDMVATQRRRLR